MQINLPVSDGAALPSLQLPSVQFLLPVLPILPAVPVVSAGMLDLRALGG